MATQVVMPQLGESIVEGTVTKWLRQEGESINEFDPLLEVNTDKVDTEVPSPAAGTILKILVPENTTVQAGALLAWIGQPGEAVPSGEAAPAAPAAVQDTAAPAAAQPAPVTAGRREGLGFISPVVARIAQENNIDLTQVKGTGEGGRITKKDVETFLVMRKMEPEPTHPEAIHVPIWETPSDGELFRPTEMFPQMIPTPPAASPAVPVKTPPAAPAPVPLAASDMLVPLTPVRKTIADHMLLSVHTSPHVTTVQEADMSRVTAHRMVTKADFERDGAHLTFTAYFVSAMVAALKAFPLVNSSWSDQGVVVHNIINIGVAVSLGDEGLIVPVIKGADGLSLLGLARAVNDLSERARAHRLQPDEVKGSTFSLTNYGTGGSLFATPIISQPNCAILGTGKIQKRAVVIEDAIAIRPMTYLTLTFDHRILDGAIADHFLAKVVETLEKW